MRAGRLEEFGERPKVVVVGGSHCAVVRLGDSVYAFESLCPHAKWPLGFIGRAFVSREGRPMLLCAMHGGVWDLATGEGTIEGRPAPPIRLYPVEVVDGEVHVRL